MVEPGAEVPPQMAQTCEVGGVGCRRGFHFDTDDAAVTSPEQAINLDAVLRSVMKQSSTDIAPRELPSDLPEDKFPSADLPAVGCVRAALG